MDGSPIKLGILGGTFNPIHFGHLRAAEEAADWLNLDRVCFIPAARPPHKNPAPLVEPVHRLEMTRLAVADRPGFFVSDVEARRTGPSYTLETLIYFHQAYGPGLNLYFLTGLDAILEVGTWKEYRRIFELTSFIVLSRPGADPELLSKVLVQEVSPDYAWNQDDQAYRSPGRHPVFYRTITSLAIASTDIRQRIKCGSSIRYLLPEAVRKYIKDNGLYL